MRPYPHSYKIRLGKSGGTWAWEVFRIHEVDPFSRGVLGSKVGARRMAEGACNADAERIRSIETYEYTP